MTGVGRVNNWSGPFISQHTKIVILVRFTYESPYFLSNCVLWKIVDGMLAKRFLVVVNS